MTFSILRKVIEISRGDFDELPIEVEEIVSEIIYRNVKARTPYLAPKETKESIALRTCLENLAKNEYIQSNPTERNHDYP